MPVRHTPKGGGQGYTGGRFVGSSGHDAEIAYEDLPLPKRRWSGPKDDTEIAVEDLPPRKMSPGDHVQYAVLARVMNKVMDRVGEQTRHKPRSLKDVARNHLTRAVLTKELRKLQRDVRDNRDRAVVNGMIDGLLDNSIEYINSRYSKNIFKDILSLTSRGLAREILKIIDEIIW